MIGFVRRTRRTGPPCSQHELNFGRMPRNSKRLSQPSLTKVAVSVASLLERPACIAAPLNTLFRSWLWLWVRPRRRQPFGRLQLSSCERDRVPPAPLIRPRRLLILQLHLVHHLLHVWNGGGQRLHLFAHRLRSDVSGQRQDAVFR
jgi:hypothetical protein